MFDFDAGKLIIVGIVALIFIPSKDLPRVLRQVGQFVGKMKRMASDFQGQFMDAMREADMADLRKEAQKLADSAKIDVGFDSMHDLRRDLEAKPDGSKPDADEAQHHAPDIKAADLSPQPVMVSHEGEAHQPREARDSNPHEPELHEPELHESKLHDPKLHDKEEPRDKAESAASVVPHSA